MIKLFKKEETTHNSDKLLNGEFQTFDRKLKDGTKFQQLLEAKKSASANKKKYLLPKEIKNEISHLSFISKIKIKFWHKRMCIFEPIQKLTYTCEYKYLTAKENFEFNLNSAKQSQKNKAMLSDSWKRLLAFKKTQKFHSYSGYQTLHDQLKQELNANSDDLLARTITWREFKKQKNNIYKKFLTEVKKYNFEHKNSHSTPNEELKKLKSEYKNKISNLYSQKKEKLISKKAYKQEKKILQLFYKGDRKTISFQKPNIEVFEEFKFAFFNNFKSKGKTKKIHKNNLIYIRNTIPFENILKGRKYIVAFANFILPGLGTAMNRSYIKAVVMFISTAALMAATLIVSLGMFGEIAGVVSFAQGDGLIGLKTLGSHMDTATSRVDSQFMLIEGMISIILIMIYAIYALISARNAYAHAKAMEIGKRNTGWRGTVKFLTEDGTPYLISVPVFILIAFSTILPLITSIMIAFTNMGETGHIPPADLVQWTGLTNLKSVFDFSGLIGKRFLRVIGWTFIWGIGSTLSTMVAGAGLAIVVNNERIKFKGLIRLIYALPIAIPGLITILYFSIIFTDDGFINQKLAPILFPWMEDKKNFFGDTIKNIQWKSDENTIKSLLFVMNIWLGFGGMFILTTGLLQGIRKDLYEAADIDGAGSMRKFNKITGPILLRQTAPMLIGAFVGGLNNFGLIYLFSQGGPDSLDSGGPGKTDILISYVFKLVNDKHQPALGAAYILVLGLVMVTIGMIGFLRSKTFREDY